MAERCATLDELLTEAPELATLGSVSTARLLVDSNPAPGDSFTITDAQATLPTSETYVAGTDFVIGANETETAANIVTALASSSLVNASSIGAGVYLATKATGPRTLYTLASTAASLVPSSAAMSGGAAYLESLLACTCRMINLACWGAKASCASAYLAAHFALVAEGEETGPVSSRTLDKLAESYASNPSSDADFGSTKYGRLYVALRKTLIIAPIVGRTGPVIGPFFVV